MVKISVGLKKLLLASNLGLNANHPLAGWNILTILYHDGTRGGEPITLNFLLQRYNLEYLDADHSETPISDAVLKKILVTLSEQAQLIEVSPRKIRVRMQNGTYHVQHSYVYRITSSGIEYINMMQKVVDAESTVTANITRINEYCQLVEVLARGQLNSQTTKLYNSFQNMITAYEDVMKGMHKLDEDLDELANNLAFNHGSQIAQHLQEMLQQQALPAFNQLLNQGRLIQNLNNSATFSNDVAQSQQGSDDLDTAHAIYDTNKMMLRTQRTSRYVQRKLAQLNESFDPSSTAIDNSLDTVYLLFHTIHHAVDLLSEEYDYVQNQTVDIQQLTAQIDKLLMNYRSLSIAAPIPRHLAQDREELDSADLLDAGTMGPVKYVANARTKQSMTVQDNPELAGDGDMDSHMQDGLIEFQELVMTDEVHGIVDHDLEFKTTIARDEVARLYSATGYDHYDSFAPFGRAVKHVRAVNSGVINLHCVGEQFNVRLPSGFTIDLTEEN